MISLRASTVGKGFKVALSRCAAYLLRYPAWWWKCSWVSDCVHSLESSADYSLAYTWPAPSLSWGVLWSSRCSLSINTRNFKILPKDLKTCLLVTISCSHDLTQMWAPLDPPTSTLDCDIWWPCVCVQGGWVSPYCWSALSIFKWCMSDTINIIKAI